MQLVELLELVASFEVGGFLGRQLVFFRGPVLRVSCLHQRKCFTLEFYSWNAEYGRVMLDIWNPNTERYEEKTYDNVDLDTLYHLYFWFRNKSYFDFNRLPAPTG